MMRFLALSCLLSAAFPAPSRADADSAFEALLRRVGAYLNQPEIRNQDSIAAVAAVRGGIPTELGENLDQRLLDRVRVLRAALRRPDPSARVEAAAKTIYAALAASQDVQALAVAGGGLSRSVAARDLDRWARSPRARAVPAPVRRLLTGPPGRINDKTLVAQGWGGYVRGLTPAAASYPGAARGWSDNPQAARLGESLKAVLDALDQKKLDAREQVQAHVLAADLYRALSRADLRGRADAGAVSVTAGLPVLDDGPAPPRAPASAFDPRAIYQKDAPSVVLILCASGSGAGELGTGSVVDAARRLILTNAHVVIRAATVAPWSDIRVYFKPARMTGDPKRDLQNPVVGRVVAYDRALDLALVKVPSLPAAATGIALGDPRAVDVGDPVAAIGHPEQGGLWTLTTGVISTRVADIGGVAGKNAFQTDTSINRGNSGGPLLDGYGRMVGINTSMARQAADGLAITAVNFAIRSDVARRWMAAQNELLAYGGAAPLVASADAPRERALAPALVPPPAPSPVVSAAPAATSQAIASPAPPPAHVEVTESRPYDRGAVLRAQIAEMDSMGQEMDQEIQESMSR